MPTSKVLALIAFLQISPLAFAQASDVIIPLGRVPGSMASDNNYDNGLPKFPPKRMPKDLKRCTRFVRDNSLYLRCPSDA